METFRADQLRALGLPSEFVQDEDKHPAAPEVVRRSDPGTLDVSVRVAAFTGGNYASPRRYRVYQYIPHLRTHGVQVTEYVARLGSWPPSRRAARPFWLPATLLDRVPAVMKSYFHDVTLLQREMVSTLLTLERFTHRPRVLDVDDAVWLNRRAGKNFPALARMCDGVICGNDFIAQNVEQWNKNTFLLPTPVDTDQFCPLADSGARSSRRIIGWSGVDFNLKYLLEIERPLAVVLEKRKDAVLRVVSRTRPKFRLLDESRVEFIEWSPENDVRTVREMSIGLMPLEDSPWGWGKCSYKMLLYMACGMPVVVSPVGMNNQVLSLGDVGFGARSEAEWADSILWLLDHPGKAAEMGARARGIVEEHYSLRGLAPRLARYLKTFSS